MKPIIRKIEDRFNTPFAVFENLLGNYIVRPLDWEGIWNPDGKLVGGNSIVSCPIKEDAEMICDTFNRFFELLKENKQLKLDNQKLEYCLNEYTSLYKDDYTKVAIKKVISLIKSHFEKDEDNFKKVSEEIIKDLFDSKNESPDELARYIQVQMFNAPSFVPMEDKDE